jgi:hypothetical protein
MAESKFTYKDQDGVRRTGIWDEEYPGRYVVKTEVDLTQTIENNKIVREMQPARATNRLVARGVPLTVYEQSIVENWDESDWNKWLNDPDNAAFRIWPGRV